MHWLFALTTFRIMTGAYYRHLISSFVIFFIVLLPTLSYSQESRPRIRETNPNYDQGDWVSYSVARFVTSIAVGTEYVYFGTTESGITRYDQFRNSWDFPWTTSNGLADNEILALAFDQTTGYLWCASRTAVSFYHPTGKRWHNSFNDEFGLPFSDEIESIGVAKNRILFLTRGGRLFESNKFGGIVLVANTIFDNPLRDQNVRWFGKAASRLKNLPHFFMSNGYLFNPVGIIEDFNFRRAEISAAVPDNWGNLWIGTRGLGAGKGDLNSMQLSMLNYGIAKRGVNALNFHNEVLWIASASRSNQSQQSITAWDLNRDTWKIYDQRSISGLTSDEVNSITVDGDTIWFSTGYGLSLYSTKSGNWKTYDRFDGLSDNIIFDTVTDDSTIWVGTANGIDRIEKNSLGKKDSLKISPVSPGNLTIVEVYDLELMENLLWAATNQGIYVYDTYKREGGFSNEIGGPTTNVINSISRYENEIWFGSLEGIDVFDVEKQEWRGVPEGRFFPRTRVNRIVATKKAVWAGTDQGVMKYNRKTKSWRTFTIEDGLIDNHVNAILLDGDHIWFGTDLGLTCFFWDSPNRID